MESCFMIANEGQLVNHNDLCQPLFAFRVSQLPLRQLSLLLNRSAYKTPKDRQPSTSPSNIKTALKPFKDNLETSESSSNARQS